MRIVDYLFLPPGPARWGGVLFGAFAALAVGIALLTAVMYEINQHHALNRRVARRLFYWGSGLQVVGLLLLGFRALGWPVLSARILMYALVAAEVFAAGYLWWWVKRRYPVLATAYELEERKRTYIPRGSGGTLEPARRPAGARRRR